jgi:dTDP-4-dehydrorhamnose reductase
MNKVIVIGGAGQLGQCLQAVAQQKNLEHIIFLPREQANLLEPATLAAVFNEHKPAYCINCAAYTAVDKAEDEPELCHQINQDGILNLSKVCAQAGVTLIHISTDFVFSGQHFSPLTESDSTGPVSVYGASKLAGEQAIMANLQPYFIIRTSWLYSQYSNNFVKTMLRFGKERDELRVIWDQIGTPTYAIDLAQAILEIIASNSKEYGIYHYSNEGLTSWYDFAKAIFELSNMSVKVVPVRTAEYVTKAKRPAYSVLDKAKIKNKLGIAIPHWRDSLKTCLTYL